jgi:hypothetical protein
VPAEYQAGFLEIFAHYGLPAPDHAAAEAVAGGSTSNLGPTSGPEWQLSARIRRPCVGAANKIPVPTGEGDWSVRSGRP